MTAQTGPGKAHRQGPSLIELADLFPDEQAARDWIEGQRWPDGAHCPHCGSARVSAVASGKPMPWRCRDCRKHFSVRTGTVMAGSKLPLRKWAFAVYLCATSLKGVSSMKLHRDLNITQRSAWFLAHRIREAFEAEGGLFAGPVQVDETYMGSKRKNMPKAKRETLEGRGAVGKVAVAGAKDRATKHVSAAVVPATDTPTLQGFARAEAGAKVYTDDARAYRGMPGFDHMESFRAMLKRGYRGTFHHFSAKHMQRYVNEFAARQGLQERDTVDMMGAVVARIIGRRLTYRRLIGRVAA